MTAARTCALARVDSTLLPLLVASRLEALTCVGLSAAIVDMIAAALVSAALAAVLEACRLEQSSIRMASAFAAKRVESVFTLFSGHFSTVRT